MTTFLLNAPVLTAYGEWRFSGPLAIDAAREIVARGFVSAIGHVGAAQFLGSQLGLDIPVSRVSISMEPGDQALVLRLNGRLPEGRSLTLEEMAAVPSELGWLQRIK